jgi:hypothetical protein
MPEPLQRSSLDYFLDEWFVPTTWFLSDMFYLLLYFSAFVLKFLPMKCDANSNKNNIKSLSPAKTTTSCFFLSSRIKTFVHDFNVTFDSLRLFLADFVQFKFGVKMVSLSVLVKWIIFFNVCGAFLKTLIKVTSLITVYAKLFAYK